MATIQTAIQLQDNFSNVLYNIIDAVNLSLSAMCDLQHTMDTPVDMASLDHARDAINQATIAVQGLNTAMGKIKSPTISPISVPLQMPQPIHWQSYDGLEVFKNTGIERFNQEIASVNSMLQELNATQSHITQTAAESEVLSPQARYDVEAVETRIQALRQSIEQMAQNPLNIGSDSANASLEQLRGRLSQTLELQENLNTAMQGADISEINATYLQLSQTIRNTERQVRDSFAQFEPVEIPITWQVDKFDVFTSSGMERFQQEIESTNSILANLTETQNEISRNAQNIMILPENALADIQNLEHRIEQLHASIEAATQAPFDVNSDEANTRLEQLRSQLLRLTELQDNFRTALQQDVSTGNIESLNTTYLQLSRNISNVERNIRDNFTQVEVPVTWKTEPLEVFSSTGMERFQQEVQNTNHMLTTLHTTQERISQTAAQANLFPANAISDMNNMGNRLQVIQQRIQQIESNPLNMGTDTANAELEQLRSQLNQAVQEQENLNRAVENMDVQAANEAYLRLSQTVGNTERYIRDNVDEQGRFNQEISEGVTNADNLMDRIKGVVAAYATIQTATKALDLSDTLTSTTARLNLMNDGLQSTQDLQDMIYLSAERSRGSYQDTADAVSKLGLMAGDAFGSSAEIVAFTEQINKQFAIAGTETSGIEAAMLQLTQAMGSGVLRGEEYNSILEQAPNIIQAIADYMDVPKGRLKDMAGEGQITADIVKAAMFAAADETNAKFESMPMTFSQIWTSFQNTASRELQPVFDRMNNFANSTIFAEMVCEGERAIALLVDGVLTTMTLMEQTGQPIADNWSIISPIIYGVAATLAIYAGYLAVTKTAEMASAAAKVILTVAEYAHAAATHSAVAATTAQTAAQMGLNTALLASPITWIIIGVATLIALYYAAVAAVNKFRGTSVSATGIVAGAIWTLGAVAQNVSSLAINSGVAFINFLGNAFNHPVAAVKVLFYDLAVTVLGFFQKIAHGIDNLLSKIPGIEWSLSSGIDRFYAELAAAQQSIKDESGWIEYAQKMEFVSYEDAASKGYDFGVGLVDQISGFFSGESNKPEYEVDWNQYATDADSYANALAASTLGDDIGTTASGISDIVDDLDITSEDLKYLRDIAEREVINRFTTAEIHIEQNNTNYVDKDTDLDGIMDVWATEFAEKLEISEEGVHE